MEKIAAMSKALKVEKPNNLGRVDDQELSDCCEYVKGLMETAHSENKYQQFDMLNILIGDISSKTQRLADPDTDKETALQLKRQLKNFMEVVDRLKNNMLD